ncbi:LPS translocon maturation chaperone LptM [Psychrobacter aestuarii]|uniref:Lipoprotein n=1 Tax=Psychrobacter aestuarii TaxID=556327 RepID=A0ABN0VK24_9GAMM|nr:lipoprotein [Psychrobacter aestuarii]
MSGSFLLADKPYTALLARLIAVVVLGSTFVLAGCGQKGDLYLPEGNASDEGQQMIDSGSAPQDDAFDRVGDDTMDDLPEASADPNDY